MSEYHTRKNTFMSEYPFLYYTFMSQCCPPHMRRLQEQGISLLSVFLSRHRQDDLAAVFTALKDGMRLSGFGYRKDLVDVRRELPRLKGWPHVARKPREDLRLLLGRTPPQGRADQAKVLAPEEVHVDGRLGTGHGS